MERTPPASNSKRRSPRKLSLEPTSARKAAGQQSQEEKDGRTPTRAKSELPTSTSKSSHPSDNPFLVQSGMNDNHQQEVEGGGLGLGASQSRSAAATGIGGELDFENLNPFGTRVTRGMDYDERPIKGSSGIGYNLNLEEVDGFKDNRRDEMRDTAAVVGHSDNPTSTSNLNTATMQQVEDDISNTPKQSNQPIVDENVARHRSTSASAQPIQHQSQSQSRPQSQIPRAIQTINPTISTQNNNQNASRSSSNGPAPPPSTSKLTTFNPSASNPYPSTTPLKAKPNVINTPLTPTEHYNPVVRAERVATLELVNVKKELSGLKKQLSSLEKKLKLSEEKREEHLQDAEGWADECRTNEEKFNLEKLRLEKELEGLEKNLEDSEIYRKESKIHDEGKLLSLLWLKDNLRDANCELVYARNEITYQSHRCIELEINLNEEKEIKEKLFEHLEKSKSKLKKMKMDFEDQLRERNEEIDELNNQNLELEEKLENLMNEEKEDKGKEVENLENELTILQMSLKEGQRELSQVRKELEKESKKVGKLEIAKEKETSEKEELKKRVKELEKKVSSFRD